MPRLMVPVRGQSLCGNLIVVAATGLEIIGDEFRSLVETLYPTGEHAQLLQLDDLIQCPLRKPDLKALGDKFQNLLDLLDAETDVSFQRRGTHQDLLVNTELVPDQLNDPAEHV